MKHNMISKLKDGLVVSCQALENEPLYGSHIMAAMASAAEEGGAVAIRANSPQDIYEIKQKCSLPVIGLYKKEYSDSKVYITPTIKEVQELVEAGTDMVAVDCTKLPRPGQESLEHFIASIRNQFPELPIIGDISTFEEGMRAIDLGVDVVSTTMSGYTDHSTQQEAPDIQLVGQLASLQRIPVLAEGRIWSVDECISCFDQGAYAVVVGTAITRPQLIVKRYVQGIQRNKITSI